MSILELLDIDIKKNKVISVVGGGGKTSLIFRLTEELVALGKKVIVTTTTHMAYEPERPFARDGKLEKIREDLAKEGYTVAGSFVEQRYGRNTKNADAGPVGVRTGREGEEASCCKIQGLLEERLPELQKECDMLLIEADGAKRLPLKFPAEWEPVIPEMTDLVVGVTGLDCLGKRIADTCHRPEFMSEFLGKDIWEKVTEADVASIAAASSGLRKNVENREFRVFLNKADVLEDPKAADRIIQELKKQKVSAVSGSLKYRAQKKLAIVILAAGNSRRFGKNKLLYPVEGVPMYQRAFHKALLARKKMQDQISSVVVVTQYPEIVEEAEKLGIKTVLNPHPEEGISSSMKLGLLPEADACLFMVADQPWLSADTLEGLICSFLGSEKGMASVSRNGEPGNPCIFSRKYYRSLLALTGDKGGKRVLNAHPEDVVLYEIENEKELTDVDQPL